MKRQRSDHRDLGCDLVMVITWLFQDNMSGKKGTGAQEGHKLAY